MDNFIFKILYIDPKWFYSVFNINARALMPQTAQLDSDNIQKKTRFVDSFIHIDDPLKAESETILFVAHLLYDLFKIDAPGRQLKGDDTDVSIIKAYIDQNYSEQIHLDDLSELSGKSKFSLLRKFKEVYKLTPHAYLLNERINSAKQLLLKGETVAQTAAMSGFFDQSHFVKVFRQYVGMNPIEYK